MRSFTDTSSLIPEIERYLATVELFRALGHQPCWLPEPPPREPIIPPIVSTVS